MLDGFTNGFKLECSGPEDVKQEAPNLKLNGESDILWNKVMKEVQAKRYAGPFKEILYENYIQSPIGLVPKDNGKDVRLIFHLSYPRNSTTSKSVNAQTPREKCIVHYPEFNKAVQLCMKAGKSCKLSKSDMKSAFRNLCMQVADFRWLIMKAVLPIDNKTYYFVDKCLPFGASISCSHFQAFSDAIAHVLKYKSEMDNVNYLDDFLFIALLMALCNAQVELFLSICERINFPVSIEKTFWSATRMTFLGYLLDTVTQTVSIPMEKIDKGRELIQNTLKCKKMTVKHMQKICGFLNFLGRCIVPGRAFTRRLYISGTM